MKKLKKRRKDKIFHDLVVLLLFPCICLGIGFYCGNTIGVVGNRKLIYILGAIFVVACFIQLFYDYHLTRIHVNDERKNHILKKWYWGILGLIFACFYNYYYPIYIKSYKENIFGIDQNQYIFIVNISLFLVLGIFINQILFRNYSIKNIGKDGIELECNEDINTLALETNTEMIRRMGEQLAALDEVVDALCELGYVDAKLEYSLYNDLLERVLQPITYDLEEVFIEVLSKDEYESFLRTEMKLPQYVIKKNNYLFAECGIIGIDDYIHIKFKLAEFHEFVERESYIVVKLDTLYDISVGELLYGYLKSFEALYSKYL